MSCLMMTIAAHAENVALVAGGAGFIGSNLCKRLLKEGYTVYCVDNLYTGRKENISELLEHNTFFFIEHNIIHPLSLDIPLDYVFNLTCPASPPHYQKDPFFTIDTSISGAKNLGNDGEFTIKELATKIVVYTNSKSVISYEAPHQDDPKIRKPDLTKANKYLNWQPKIDLDKGIEKTTAYFKTQ